MSIVGDVVRPRPAAATSFVVASIAFRPSRNDGVIIGQDDADGHAVNHAAQIPSGLGNGFVGSGRLPVTVRRNRPVARSLPATTLRSSALLGRCDERNDMTEFSPRQSAGFILGIIVGLQNIAVSVVPAIQESGEQEPPMPVVAFGVAAGLLIIGLLVVGRQSGRVGSSAPRPC